MVAESAAAAAAPLAMVRGGIAAEQRQNSSGQVFGALFFIAPFCRVSGGIQPRVRFQMQTC